MSTDDSYPDQDPRQAILARRKRLIAAALAGAGLVVGSAACKDDATRETGQQSSSTAPLPCLTMDPRDATAAPCLKAPAPDVADAAAKENDAGIADAGKALPKLPPGPCLAAPRPCLTTVPPKVCLKPTQPPRNR